MVREFFYKKTFAFAIEDGTSFTPKNKDNRERRKRKLQELQFSFSNKKLHSKRFGKGGIKWKLMVEMVMITKCMTTLKRNQKDIKGLGMVVPPLHSNEWSVQSCKLSNTLISFVVVTESLL